MLWPIAPAKYDCDYDCPCTLPKIYPNAECAVLSNQTGKKQMILADGLYWSGACRSEHPLTVDIRHMHLHIRLLSVRVSCSSCLTNLNSTMVLIISNIKHSVIFVNYTVKILILLWTSVQTQCTSYAGKHTLMNSLPMCCMLETKVNVHQSSATSNQHTHPNHVT